MRSISATAHINLLSDELLMRSIIARLKKRSPQWASVDILHDEASQRMQLNVMSREIKQTMKCLVIQLICSWGFENGEVEFFIPIAPTVLILMCSAAAMWDGIRRHPLSRHVWQFVDDLLSLA